jgi:hypothetical protein
VQTNFGSAGWSSGDICATLYKTHRHGDPGAGCLHSLAGGHQLAKLRAEMWFLRSACLLVRLVSYLTLPPYSFPWVRCRLNQSSSRCIPLPTATTRTCSLSRREGRNTTWITTSSYPHFRIREPCAIPTRAERLRRSLRTLPTYSFLLSLYFMFKKGRMPLGQARFIISTVPSFVMYIPRSKSYRRALALRSY